MRNTSTTNCDALWGIIVEYKKAFGGLCTKWCMCGSINSAIR